jgi:hypothetical protein
VTKWQVQLTFFIFFCILLCLKASFALTVSLHIMIMKLKHYIIYYT